MNYYLIACVRQKKKINFIVQTSGWQKAGWSINKFKICRVWTSKRAMKATIHTCTLVLYIEIHTVALLQCLNTRHVLNEHFRMKYSIMKYKQNWIHCGIDRKKKIVMRLNFIILRELIVQASYGTARVCMGNLSFIEHVSQFLGNTVYMYSWHCLL